MAAPPALKLTGIPTVSPSLAELLRLCPLRAGLSRVQDANALVLGNPRAWLGTAYHEVVATAARVNSVDAVAEVWDQAVRAEYERARAHPLDQRFGPPERWPGYHFVRAMALVRTDRVDHPAGGSGTADKPQTDPVRGHERWLKGAGGRLVGRPDLLSDDAVIDYKTGDVFEPGATKVIRPSYIRQLQFYGFLVKESTGRWPARGVLRPMGQPAIEVDLRASDCERIAEEALGMLDAYNDALSATGVTGLATPSPEACRWCPFKLPCPAFWTAADNSWSEHLGTVAVGGHTLSAPIPIHGGRALAVHINVEEGTEMNDSVYVAPLQSATHPILQRVRSDTRVRIVGLAKRMDGSTKPTLSTVVARTEELPEIVLAEKRPRPSTNADVGRCGDGEP